MVTSPSAFIVPHCEQALTIIACDDDIIVIDKPAGLLSVPGKHPANNDSVATRLRADCGEIHIAHRLDMSTSGLMVVARNKSALRALNHQFASRRVDKEYTARVYGLVANDQGEINQPILCDWPNRPRQKIDPDGKQALTRFTVIRRWTASHQTELRLVPITGRSHQLRIHMAHIGHPILGCEFYAHTQAKALSNQLLLHASQLSFLHPSTNEHRVFKSPADFPAPKITTCQR